MQNQNQTQTRNTNTRSFIGLVEAAYDIGISHKTLQNWLVRGKFPCETVKVGDRRLIPVDAWQAWKDSLRATPSPTPIHTNTTTTPNVKRGRGRPRKDIGVGYETSK